MVESPLEAVPIIFYNYNLHNAAPKGRNDLEVCQRAAPTFQGSLGFCDENALLGLCLAGRNYITYLARDITECF